MNLEGSSIEVSDSVSYFAAPDTCPVARRLTSRITPPSPQLRGFVRTLPNTVPAHRHAWSLFDVFDAIEIGGDSDRQSLGSPELRIGFWNAERCKHLDDSVDLIRSADLDVLLLAEMDRGMARSGGWHTARALAERLGWFYVWGVEFVELGLGDSRERSWHRGEKNTEGLHGNAILSRIPLRDPVLVRLDDGATWFAEAAEGQRRVGGRMGLGACIQLAGKEIAVFAVHIESRSSPEHRAQQTGNLLHAVNTVYGGIPVVVGGDFNSCTLVRPDENTLATRRALATADPSRFLRPVPFEPLFEAAQDFGYDWQTCNHLDHPSQRTRPDGTPEPPLGKLDWFLTRDLAALDSQTVAAVAPGNRAISDHDLIKVNVC